MRTKVLLFVLIALLSGCATKEGLKLPSGSRPTRESAEDFNKRNSAVQPPAPAPAPAGMVPRDTVASALIPDAGGPRMIIVGNVMALTVFDEPTLGSRYDNYLKQVQARSGTPGFTREWYLATSSGETAVKFSGVTGIYSRFFKADIPKDLIRQITFASAFGTFMAGTSGDLVAAERSAKNGTWVTRLLCSEKATDYAVCEARYTRGIFQSSDGKEIDDKLQLVASGKTIDPVSYVTSMHAGQGSVGRSLDAKPVDSQIPSSPAPASVAVTLTPAQAVAPAAIALPIAGTTSPGNGQSKDAAQQLAKLNELRAKGLITEAEYQTKRKEILDSL